MQWLQTPPLIKLNKLVVKELQPQRSLALKKTDKGQLMLPFQTLAH
ncbi:hypothetical protein OM945_10750 [Levilactobacillus namurensis]|nr:hypothetical protein [Levilactobacillus namurensis]